MKCISKKKAARTAALFLTSSVLLCGCREEIVLENRYDLFETTQEYGMDVPAADTVTTYFADQLCVAGTENILSDTVSEQLSEAAGLFDIQGHTVKFAKNIYQRMYPASTTKILTAYTALKHGDLTATATVTKEELQLENGSTTCGLSVGDTISLQDLLYGLMLCSGNDAANVIADLVAGSTEQFAALMNQEALALGATNSHFVNPHGLHNEEHYTTVYDMYLIFQAAVQNEQFLSLIGTQNYTANFVSASGETITKDWTTTNKYLKGEETAPEGIHVIGGKTGTTGDAGYCLVLYSKKDDSIPFVSIVFKADSRSNLYHEMTELLEEISK